MKTLSSAVAARPARSSLVEDLEPRRLMSTTVTITNTQAQTIDGFGTSLGGVTSQSLINTTKFQKAYYQDLGASMFRVALNPWLLRGTTARGKQSIGVPVEMGPHLSRNIAQFDFKNANIQKYGKMAAAAKKYGSDVKIIGSIWSPPFWMKGVEINPSTGKSTGTMPTYDDQSGNTSGGSLIDTDANLTQFARYVAAYVSGFEKSFGVHLDAVSIQNELAFHEYYSSAVYDPKLYVKAVKAVNRWFVKYGIDTKIIGPEDVGVGSTTDTGMLNRQMAYIKALRADRDAAGAIGAYAIHGYADDGQSDQRSPEMWARYWNGQKGTSGYNTYAGIKSDNKPTWMTEASGFINNWNAAMRLASSIQDGLVQGNLSAYVYWGITNTSDNGEALMKNADYASGKYSVFKHFSAYVRPGAVRLQTSKTDPNGVYASAFTDKKHAQLTSVVINNTDKAQSVTIRLDGPSVTRFGTVVASTEGDTWEKLDGLKVKNGRVTIKMPARSVYTLVGSTGATAAQNDGLPPGGTIRGVYFLDSNKNGKIEKGEPLLAGDKVFIDLNGDDKREKGEPTATTAKDGSFLFAGLGKGVYRIRREVSGTWAVTTPPIVTRLRTGTMDVRRLALGVADKGHAPTHPTTPAATASIRGHAFADTDKNGQQNGTEPDTVGKTIFLDADNDGQLDSGEKRTTTDAHGDFVFKNLSAGTYRVRRVFPDGYTYSTTKITLTLTEGQAKTGVLIGSKTV